MPRAGDLVLYSSIAPRWHLQRISSTGGMIDAASGECHACLCERHAGTERCDVEHPQGDVRSARPQRPVAVNTKRRLLIVNLTTADVADSAGAHQFLDDTRDAGGEHGIRLPILPVIDSNWCTKPNTSVSR